MIIRKSTLKNIVSGCVVHSDHLIDIGKKHLKVFITVRFIKKTVLFGIQLRSSEGATRGVLYQRLFLIFPNIHRKTPV